MTSAGGADGIGVSVLAEAAGTGREIAYAVVEAFDASILGSNLEGASRAPDILVVDGSHDVGVLAAAADRLRRDWRGCETILIDGPSASEALRRRAQYVLRAGAAVCEAVHIVRSVLELRTAQRALREEVAARSSAVGRIKRAEFEFRTLEEAKNLATMLSFACPDPEAAAVGLQEILANAVEHGSLGFTGADKMALLLEGRWRTALDERMRHAPFASRVVNVTFERGVEALEFRVRDEGEGFDAAAYVAPTPGESRQANGRGIWLARAIAFDELEFLGRGNEARCVIYSKAAAAG